MLRRYREVNYSRLKPEACSYGGCPSRVQAPDIPTTPWLSVQRDG